MEYVRFTVKFASFLLLATIVGGYAFLVFHGDIPAPDINSIAAQIAPSLAVGGSTIAAIAIGFCIFLAAIAPFIYAARSGDLFTVVISIVALVICFTLLASSRTIIDMVLAAIVYFTSAFISVIMYSTNRIAAAMQVQSTLIQPTPHPRPDPGHLENAL
jgi:hypothetical protein